MGKQKAARAIAPTMLVIVYPLLAPGTCDEEARDDQWNPREEARERATGDHSPGTLGLDRNRRAGCVIVGWTSHLCSVRQRAAQRFAAPAKPQGEWCVDAESVIA